MATLLSNQKKRPQRGGTEAGIVRISLWQYLGFYDYGEHWALVALTVGTALIGIVMFALAPFVSTSRTGDLFHHRFYHPAGDAAVDTGKDHSGRVSAVGDDKSPVGSSERQSRWVNNLLPEITPWPTPPGNLCPSGGLSVRSSKCRTTAQTLHSSP